MHFYGFELEVLVDPNITEELLTHLLNTRISTNWESDNFITINRSTVQLTSSNLLTSSNTSAKSNTHNRSVSSTTPNNYISNIATSNLRMTKRLHVNNHVKNPSTTQKAVHRKLTNDPRECRPICIDTTTLDVVVFLSDIRLCVAVPLPPLSVLCCIKKTNEFIDDVIPMLHNMLDLELNHCEDIEWNISIPQWLSSSLSHQQDIHSNLIQMEVQESSAIHCDTHQYSDNISGPIPPFSETLPRPSKLQSPVSILSSIKTQLEDLKQFAKKPHYDEDHNQLVLLQLFFEPSFGIDDALKDMYNMLHQTEQLIHVLDCENQGSTGDELEKDVHCKSSNSTSNGALNNMLSDIDSSVRGDDLTDLGRNKNDEGDSINNKISILCIQREIIFSLLHHCIYFIDFGRSARQQYLSSLNFGTVVGNDILRTSTHCSYDGCVNHDIRESHSHDKLPRHEVHDYYNNPNYHHRPKLGFVPQGSSSVVTNIDRHQTSRCQCDMPPKRVIREGDIILFEMFRRSIDGSCILEIETTQGGHTSSSLYDDIFIEKVRGPVTEGHNDQKAVVSITPHLNTASDENIKKLPSNRNINQYHMNNGDSRMDQMVNHGFLPSIGFRAISTMGMRTSLGHNNIQQNVNKDNATSIFSSTNWIEEALCSEGDSDDSSDNNIRNTNRGFRNHSSSLEPASTVTVPILVSRSQSDNYSNIRNDFDNVTENNINDDNININDVVNEHGFPLLCLQSTTITRRYDIPHDYVGGTKAMKSHNVNIKSSCYFPSAQFPTFDQHFHKEIDTSIAQNEVNFLNLLKIRELSGTSWYNRAINKPCDPPWSSSTHHDNMGIKKAITSENRSRGKSIDKAERNERMGEGVGHQEMLTANELLFLKAQATSLWRRVFV